MSLSNKDPAQSVPVLLVKNPIKSVPTPVKVGVTPFSQFTEVGNVIV